jgi:hypothetical protein
MFLEYPSSCMLKVKKIRKAKKILPYRIFSLKKNYAKLIFSKNSFLTIKFYVRKVEIQLYEN